MIRKLSRWIRDYVYLMRKHMHALLVRTPPHHYLGRVLEGKAPVILLPGIYEKWHFLHAIAEPISHDGHRVYVLQDLGYNTRGIKESARMVRDLIEREDLRRVVIVAHSKGGLIGKELLLHHNVDERIIRLITIATPFAGSHLARIPLKGILELHPSSEIIRALHEERSANHLITSIYGVFDNHVWPNESAVLAGAENIRVDAHGHHAILGNPEVRRIVSEQVAKTIP